MPAFQDVPVKPHKFQVIGHRGSGMNMLQSSDRRMQAIKENTILSFNAVSKGKFPVNFVEFDVQVTIDGCPVIFHDDYISLQEDGSAVEKKVTDLTLAEFLSYGPQRESGLAGKSLLRKTKDGEFVDWKVEHDDCFCTLKQAFQEVDPLTGFNVELKFDDDIVYEEEEIVRVLDGILKVVFVCANGRPIIFSSFHPDAAKLMRKLQNTYPVFFLTEGGLHEYIDVRRNSLDEALRLCMENQLQGIVSDVEAVFQNLEAISKIKQSNLSLLTYGQLNNLADAVHRQYVMGVEGVIVDLVGEISEAVHNFLSQPAEETEEEEEEERMALVAATERSVMFVPTKLTKSLEAY